MKCSECSAVIKPVVAIDLDGTLGDYHSHFLRFAVDYLGPPSTGLDTFAYDGAETFKGWFLKTFVVDERTWRDIKLAYRQGAQKRSMPVYEDAQWLVNNLRWDGTEVWLTTTRPYLRLDGVDPDTRAWLDRHGIEYDGLLYDKDKYERLAELVDPSRVVAVLDDLPEQFDAARQQFGKDVPILRRQQYNTAVKCEPEAESLTVALGMIQDKLEVWHGTHSD
jgi:hypothetical protein